MVNEEQWVDGRRQQAGEPRSNARNQVDGQRVERQHMRAVEFGEYGTAAVLRAVDVETPHATAGTVRIAVRASGVSPGDVSLRSGKWRDLVQTTFPYRTGFDAAGVVDEVGVGVGDGLGPGGRGGDGLGPDGGSGMASTSTSRMTRAPAEHRPGSVPRVGDEVFGMVDSSTRGANADFAVLTAWAPKPTAWSWEEAAGAAGSVETATRVLDRLGVMPRADSQAEQTVLIQGAAGGVGSVAVQLAVARGAVVMAPRANPTTTSFGRWARPRRRTATA